MARIHEPSKQTEQEEQDYLYGVVPKEWCKTHRISGPEELREGQWLTFYNPREKYDFVLYKILGNNSEVIRYKGWWVHQLLGKVIRTIEDEEPPAHGTFHPVDKAYWVAITEDMAAKMRILHGF